MTQKQYLFKLQKYGNFCQLPLKIQKILMKSENCPCRLCRLYIADIAGIAGFIKL